MSQLQNVTHVPVHSQGPQRAKPSQAPECEVKPDFTDSSSRTRCSRRKTLAGHVLARGRKGGPPRQTLRQRDQDHPGAAQNRRHPSCRNSRPLRSRPVYHVPRRPRPCGLTLVSLVGCQTFGRPSVCRGFFDVVDHKNLNRPFVRRELQAELFLDRCEDRWGRVVGVAAQPG
jgi:hypothetical protein